MNIYLFAGILLLVLLVVFIIRWYINDGILFFCNYSRLAVIIWMLGLGLYDLQLSKLYKPNLLINIICILVIINFVFCCNFFPNDINKIYKIFGNAGNENERKYTEKVYLTLLLGVFSFVVNLRQGRLRWFSNNRAANTDITLSYFLNMMVPVSLFFYYRFRRSKGKIKVLFLLLTFSSIFLIFCNMSRGPIVYWLFGVVIFEIVNYCKKNKTRKITIKLFLFLLIMLIFGIWGFGYIGELRTASIYLNGTNAHYEMKANLPVGITWIYIYISSPLENLRYILSNETLNSIQFGNNLFYPAIKLIANLLGVQAEYTSWLKSSNSIYPYLKEVYGLNVSSFIADAYKDFGFIGIIVYLLCYDLIAFIIYKIIHNKEISDTSKAIIIPIVFQIAIWSIFANSAFRIAIVWVDIFVVLIWNCSLKDFYNKKIKNKISDRLRI